MAKETIECKCQSFHFYKQYIIIIKEVRILTVINVPVYLTIVILCDYNLTDLTI